VPCFKAIWTGLPRTEHRAPPTRIRDRVPNAIGPTVRVA
jgi:hypothetical protein